jgi:hypothetical protein
MMHLGSFVSVLVLALAIIHASPVIAAIAVLMYLSGSLVSRP